ncbi:hypothetical protein HY947_01515 [Candidatus Gottesmanbacteria bacterium]|nr:hypothetical protein [Candidatus Gottesmanbacteria bacterium]
MDDTTLQKALGIIENSEGSELLAVAKLRALQIPIDERIIKSAVLGDKQGELSSYLSSLASNIKANTAIYIKEDATLNSPSEGALYKALNGIQLRHKEKTDTLATKYEKRLAPFREKLVARWIEKSKEIVQSEDVIRNGIRSLVVSDNKIRASGVSILIQPSDEKELVSIIQSAEQEAKKIAQESEEIVTTALKNPAPDLLVKAYERRDELLETTPEEFIKRVVSYSASPPDGVDFTKNFFQSIAQGTNTGTIQKAIAPLYDAAFLLVVSNPEKRKQIIENAIRSGFSGTEERLQKASGNILTSDIVKKIIASESGRLKQTGSFGQARGVLDDFFGSLIGRQTGLVDKYLKTVASLDHKGTHPFGHSTLNSSIPTEHQGAVEILLFATFYQAFPQQISIIQNQQGDGWTSHMAKDIARHELFNAVFGFIRSKLFSQAATGTTAALTGLTGGAAAPAFLVSLFGEKLAGSIMSYFSNAVGSFSNRKSENYDFWIAAVLIGVVVFVLIFGFSGVITRAPMFIGMQKGGEDTFGETGSQYIRLSKTADPDNIPDNNPMPITYTIIIQATTKKLTNIRVSDEFSVYGGTGSISSPALSAPESISPGEEKTLTFVIPLSSSFKDTVITNTLTVTADAENLVGETKTAYASVIIGQPDIGCFQFKDSDGALNSCRSEAATSAWLPQEKASMIFAASQIVKYPLYTSKLKCSTAPIPLYRVRKDFGGGCFQDGGIYIYNVGVLPGSSVYTLAHETGHALQYRNGTYYQLFLSKGISSPRREGFLPTYPGTQTDAEDFAETIGLFVGYPHYYPPKWSTFPKYPTAYPLHEKFAQCLMVNSNMCNAL